MILQLFPCLIGSGTSLGRTVGRSRNTCALCWVWSSCLIGFRASQPFCSMRCMKSLHNYFKTTFHKLPTCPLDMYLTHNQETIHSSCPRLKNIYFYTAGLIISFTRIAYSVSPAMVLKSLFRGVNEGNNNTQASTAALCTGKKLCPKRNTARSESVFLSFANLI